MKSLIVLCCILALMFSFANGSCKRSLREIEQRANHTNLYERNAQLVYSYAASSTRQPSNSNALKFMTFNQQSGFIASCQSNVNAQTEWIASQSVDYLASQEIVQGVSSRCNCNMPQMIANGVGMTSRFGMAIPYGTGLYGINVAAAQIVLETKMERLNYPGVEQRLVIFVRTQPAALQGRNLWFASVHVDWGNVNARYSQITQLLAVVQTIMSNDQSAVVVLGGDFNGGPWDQGYAMVKNAGFTNAWERFKGTIEGGNTKSGNRFDHIWFKAPSAVTISVTSATVHTVELSDHYPFSAVLSFSVSGSSSSTTGNAPPAEASTRAPTTAAPTVKPTVAPTVPPTVPPTVAPVTAKPTVAPTVAPTGPNVVCVGPIYEGQTVTIACPVASQKMTVVDFANYGTNQGTCGAFRTDGCVGGSSRAVVQDKCIGRNTCTFPVANNVFGDPCSGTGKNFRVQVQCA